MKKYTLTFAGVVAVGLVLSPLPGRADSPYSPERLDILDQWGFFPPAFKAAVHELVDTKQAIAKVEKEQQSFVQQLPEAKTKADEAEAKLATLHKELADYEHTDESDFVELKKSMDDSGANLHDQFVLAQAFVWAYPASPHQSEAQTYLQLIQKKRTDQTQAEKDAEADRVAKRANLLQRVQAKSLSLNEWREFLNGMSQQDVVRYMGRPQSQSEDYWIYSGEWIQDPATQKKVGLQLNFNGGRVLSVSQASSQ